MSLSNLMEGAPVPTPELPSLFLAVDPGNENTAYVVFDTRENVPADWGKIPNATFFDVISAHRLNLVMEFPYYGKSWQTLETCEAAGKFGRHAETLGLTVTKMNRDDIKKHVGGSGRAKDPQIRRALIDRYGGETSLTGGKCPDCKGRGHSGFRLEEHPCLECGATGSVPGKKKPKKCSKCKGTTKVLVKVKQGCGQCIGSGQIPPGVLHGISADVWAALAVAVTYVEKGPSISARQREIDRKQRKADKKARQAERLAGLQKELELLQNQTGKTPAQERNRLKRIGSTQRQIQKLEKQCQPKKSPSPSTN